MSTETITAERAEWMLRMLWRIRLFEEQMLDFLNTGVIKGGSHLYIGQEAVATGVCGALTGNDYITSTHRGHGHGLAKGGESKRLMAEILGRSTGVCRGRGGSLHLADMETGNLGANGIVGGSLAIACGAALSAQMRKTGQVVACFFGDGAISTGIFHESLNMAQVWKLPVLFICENNLYAMSVSTSRAHGLEDLVTRAKGYNMRSEIVDGQDAVAVYEATRRHAETARNGGGPTFIECKTYRYGGHSRSDARKYRTRDEERKWRDRDPVDAFRKWALGQSLLNETEAEAIHAEIVEEIKETARFAQESPDASREELFDDLYA